MIDERSILDLTERIVREFGPEQIILFGSYSCGAPREDSDVDLLVILSFEGLGIQKAVEILNKVSPPFPVDLLVRTPERLRQRLEWNDFFLNEVIRKGKVLYESTHP